MVRIPRNLPEQVKKDLTIEQVFLKMKKEQEMKKLLKMMRKVLTLMEKVLKMMKKLLKMMTKLLELMTKELKTMKGELKVDQKEAALAQSGLVGICEVFLGGEAMNQPREMDNEIFFFFYFLHFLLFSSFSFIFLFSLFPLSSPFLSFFLSPFPSFLLLFYFFSSLSDGFSFSLFLFFFKFDQIVTDVWVHWMWIASCRRSSRGKIILW